MNPAPTSLSLLPTASTGILKGDDLNQACSFPNEKEWKKKNLSILPKKHKKAVDSALNQIEALLQTQQATEEARKKTISQLRDIYLSHTRAAGMKSETQNKIGAIFCAMIVKKLLLKEKATAALKMFFMQKMRNTPLLLSAITDKQELSSLFRFYRVVHLLSRHGTCTVKEQLLIADCVDRSQKTIEEKKKSLLPI